MSASQARLRQLLCPAVEATGHELEDVSVSPVGKRRVVRVVVDNSDPAGGGVTLDDVAEVARVVSDLLDAAERHEPDLLPGGYVLEVSSPGVDRPLTQPRHWARSVGRLVSAELADGTSVTGRVLRTGDGEVVFGVEGTERVLPLGEVRSGRVQVEFSRSAEEAP